MKRRMLIVAAGVVALAAVSYVGLLILSSDECVVGKASCETGKICSKGVLPPYKIARCIGELSPSSGIYVLPVRNAAGVICTQATQNPTGSHAYRNTLFALDLTSPLAGPAGDVVTARAGRVLATNADCTDPGKSDGYRDDCGHGFGNSVLVDHGDETVAFYAHLASVGVKPNQQVRVGELLGKEGITGSSGHRHLHFSVHLKSSPASVSGMSWRSIPFRIKLKEGRPANAVVVRDVRQLICPHNSFDNPRWFSP